jgi:hypothetical protein
MAYLFTIFGASIFAFIWWHGQLRKKDLQAVALRLGLHYLGETLPRSFSLSSPIFKNTTKVSNVIDGDRNGRRVIVFDYLIGSGKYSRTRTVIAVNVPPADLESLVHSSDLSIESNGHWSFLFEQRGFFTREVISVSELESYIRSVLFVESDIATPPLHHLT